VGGADGIGIAALFAYPKGVAVDAAGKVYMADTNNAAIRRMFSNRPLRLQAVPPALWGICNRRKPRRKSSASFCLLNVLISCSDAGTDEA
jgi:DNA-binding beta-propeller fold protein YncE